MSRYVFLVLTLLLSYSAQKNLQRKFIPKVQIEVCGMTLFGAFFVSNSIVTLIQMIKLGNFSKEQIKFIKETIKLRDELNKNMVSNCTSASILVESNLIIYLELEKNLLAVQNSLVSRCPDQENTKAEQFSKEIAAVEDIFYKEAYKKAFGERDLALEIENSQPVNKMKVRRILASISSSNDSLINQIIKSSTPESELDCENVNLVTKMSSDIRKNVRYTISSNLMMAQRICEDSSVKLLLNADMERTYQMMQSQEDEMRNSDSFIYELFGNKSNEELSSIARSAIDSASAKDLESALLDLEVLNATYKTGSQKRKMNGIFLLLMLLENSYEVAGVLSKGSLIKHLTESVSKLELVKLLRDHLNEKDKSEIGAQIAKYGRNYALNARDFLSYKGILKYATLIPVGNMLFKAYESFWKWSKTNFYINVSKADLAAKQDNHMISVFQDTRLRNFRLVDLQYETANFASNIAHLEEMTSLSQISFDGTLIDTEMMDSFCSLNAFYCYSKKISKEMEIKLEDRLYRRFYSDIKLVYQLNAAFTLMTMGYELVHVYEENEKVKIDSEEFDLGSTFLLSCRGCRADSGQVVYFVRDDKRMKDKGEASFSNFLYTQLDLEYRRNCKGEPKSLRLKRIVAKSKIKTLEYLDYYVHYLEMEPKDINYYKDHVECISEPRTIRAGEEINIRKDTAFPFSSENRLEEYLEGPLISKEEENYKASKSSFYFYLSAEMMQKMIKNIGIIYKAFQIIPISKDKQVILVSKVSDMPAYYYEQIKGSKNAFCSKLEENLERTTAQITVKPEVKDKIESFFVSLTNDKAFFEQIEDESNSAGFSMVASQFNNLFYERCFEKENMNVLDVLTTYWGAVATEILYTVNGGMLVFKKKVELPAESIFIPLLDMTLEAHFAYNLLAPEFNRFKELSEKIKDYENPEVTFFSRKKTVQRNLFQSYLYVQSSLMGKPARGNKFEVFDLLDFKPKSKTGLSFYTYTNEEKKIGFASVEKLKKVDYAVMFVEVMFPERDANNDYKLVFTQDKIELEQTENTDYDQTISEQVVAQIIWRTANGSTGGQTELSKLRGGLVKKFFSQNWVKVTESNDEAVNSVNIELKESEDHEPFGFLEISFFKHQELQDLSEKYRKYCAE